MKKYLVIFGAALLIMALASPSFAQFASWGHMEVETYWWNKATYFDSDKSDNRRGVGERFRFYLQYGDPKTVRAVIGFEGDSTTWGEPNAPTTSLSGNAGYTGQFGLAQRNHMGSLTTDSAALEVKHAYIDFVVPNTPVSVMAGIQNWVTGGSLGRYFLNIDAPGVRVTTKFAPHAIEAAWYKEYKQDQWKDNDSDMYMLKYNLSQKMFNVEAWVAYEADRRAQTETWAMTASTAGSVTSYTPTRTMAARNYEVKPYWIGLNVPFTVANFTITPTFIYEGGDARKYFVSGNTDVKISAWLGSLEAAYQLGPGLKLTVQGMYATGNDTGKTDKQNLFTQPNASEGQLVLGNGWDVMMWENTELTYYGYKAATIGGYYFGRFTATYSPLPWLEIQPTYVYIGDTSKKSGSGSASGSNTIGRTDDDKASVGQEINMITTFKIYDKIRYKVGVAYFITGDVFKGNYSRSGGGSPGDNAWAVLSNLNYAF